MSIKIKINSDGIWGDSDMTGVDAQASENKLEEMVAKAVVAEFGGTVEVGIEQSGMTRVCGLDNDTDQEYVREIVSEVWQTWEWVVD